MKIKHSKYKNTGILFELIIRQITSDTLEGKVSPLQKILPKYFTNTELGKEYKLYETLLKKTSITESQADVILNTLIETSKTLNRKLLKKQKYNLISEIMNHYGLNEFFNHKLPNYKTQAAFYTLLEIYNNNKPTDPNYIIENKMAILEHLTIAPIKEKSVRNKLIKEFTSYDKDTRMLAYKIMLEKFNKKYENFSTLQKSILREILYSSDNRVSLKEFYNKKSLEIESQLETLCNQVTDKVTQIKLNEVVSIIKNHRNTSKITDESLVDLLQYCELINELESVHEPA